MSPSGTTRELRAPRSGTRGRQRELRSAPPRRARRLAVQPFKPKDDEVPECFSELHGACDGHYHALYQNRLA